MTSNSKRSAELLALGEVTRNIGGERIAVDVLRDGGDIAEMIRRLYSRTWSEDGLDGLDRAAGVRLDARDLDRYSPTRAVQASLRKMSGWTAPRPNPFDANAESERRLVEADRASSCYELELSTELQRQSGWAANGFALPWSVLQRDFNVGTASEAGNVVATGKRVNLTPAAARPALALQRLGVTVLGGFRSTFTVPTLVSDQSGASFLTEVAASTEGSPDRAWSRSHRPGRARLSRSRSRPCSARRNSWTAS